MNLLPNQLSYLRILIGLSLPLLLARASTPETFISKSVLNLSLGLFIFAVFTDFLDGWIARRQKLETPYGKILDPLADKVLIFSLMLSFAAKGIYSYWFVVPMIFREVMVTFCRMVWLNGGEAVGAEKAGKLKFGFQVASVLATYLYLYHPEPWALRFNYLVLALTIGLTLYSGIAFLIHNKTLLGQKKFAWWVGTLGVGYLKPVPGTYGSLLGLFLVPFIAQDPLLHFLVFSAFWISACVFLPRLGLADHDDPVEVVIDEVCGILIAFWAQPLTWWNLVLGFLLFRFFDVTKIFPLNWLEKRKGVYGIMLDDAGAGVYAWLILSMINGFYAS